MTDGLIVFDGQGTILELNPTAHRLHQLESSKTNPPSLSSLEQLLEFRQLDNQPLPFKQWPTQRLLDGERFSGYQVRGRHKDSGHSWIGSYSGTPITNEKGELRLGILEIRPVTAQEKTQVDLKQLMAQLEAEQAKLQAIIQHAPEAIAVADVHGRIVLTNPAAEKLEGWLGASQKGSADRVQPMLSRPHGIPYNYDELPLTRSAIQGISIRDEKVVVRWEDGQQRDLLVSAAPIFDQQGSLNGAVGIFQDITHLKQTQDALRRYVGRLQALHEIDRAILMASSVQDLAQSALRHLHALFSCHWSGVVLFDQEADQSQLVASMAHDENPVKDGWSGRFQNDWPVSLLSQGQTVTLERDSLVRYAFPRLLRQGGVRLMTSVPLTTRGELIGTLNLGFGGSGELNAQQIEMVTEVANHLAIGIKQNQLQKQVQDYADHLERMVELRTARLRASEARFRTIFEESGMGIILLDKTGCLLETNPALQALLGYSDQELRGKPFTELVQVDKSLADMQSFAELMAGQRDFNRMEMRFVRRDGRLGWANVTLSLIKRGVDAERFAIGMVEDITERKKAQEALIQAEKLAVTGKLAASMVHEINNPLQSVIGFLALADETLAEGGDLSNYLQIAREELMRTARIVGQLRSLQRRSDLEDRKPTDINQLVEQVLALSQRRCERSRVQVNWLPSENLAPLSLVADRIQQVFLNLVLNALDAMPDGGRLDVRTFATHEPPGVGVTFVDSGKGIPGKDLPRVFEPFFTTKQDGIGLGLHVSRKIVEQHGGRLEVNSQVGQGTTFRIWLPVQG